MVFQKTITFRTHSKEDLYDITSTVEEIVQETADNPGIVSGTCSVYAQGATGAIMIQENWDHSVQTDVLTLLRKLAPPGVWEHDRQDSTCRWQNIFLFLSCTTTKLKDTILSLFLT